LQFDNRDDFVAFMTKGQPARPANILNIVAINQGKLPLTTGAPEASALDADHFAELCADGHVVVDTRSSAAFGSGHVPGSYNIHLSSREFEQRVGWVTPPDDPILLVLDGDELVERALLALAFIGLDQRVVGYLKGGIGAWIRAGKRVSTLPQISVHEVHRNVGKNGTMKLLDVREKVEWDGGHIEGAHHMSYKDLREHIGELTLNPDEHISVICAMGARSGTASSILRVNGFQNVHNVTGGMAAWSSADLPITRD
jgi:rhodanese-related sulfurtransferase